jgi:nitrogenase molybdenum-iron protein alpha/beta subunit
MTASRDFALRTTPTFMAGSLLVANAISDSVLIYRGSSCVAEHVAQTFQFHDFAHGLSPNRDNGRVVLTMDPDTASVMGTSDAVELAAEWVLKNRRVGVLLLSELCRYTLMGESLEGLAGRLRAMTGQACVPALAGTIERDFTGAFSSLSKGLAEAVVSEAEARPTEGKVAVIGYLFSRNEGDAKGDILELRRMLEALDLDLCSLWFCGGRWEDLAAATEASALVALPFGAEAAQILANHSGVESVATDLPVSIRGTIDWLTAVGEALGRSKAVESFVDRELVRVLPMLDQFVTRRFQGKRVLVAATEDWAPGITRMLSEDLGMDVVATILRHRPSPGYTPLSSQPADLLRQVDPSVASLRHHVEHAVQKGGLDLVVGSFWERSALLDDFGDIPFLEFGFPQRDVHFLVPTPHLGFSGVVTWAQRIFDALSVNSQ